MVEAQIKYGLGQYLGLALVYGEKGMTAEVDGLLADYGVDEYFHRDTRESRKAVLEAFSRLQRELQEQQRLVEGLRELADDLLEDLELQGLHDDPEWNYRKQKAEFRRLDAAIKEKQ